MTVSPYQYSVPTAGATVSPADWCETCSLNPAGTLATLTVNFPKQPNDGQPFTLNTTQIVTALTMASTSTPAQVRPFVPSALAIGVSYRWVYNAPKNTWMPG